jgi:hypothetical protein
MLYKTEDCEYLYKSLKNGDFLGFYTKPWYYLFARLIALVTGNKLSHIAGVFDVKRKSGVLTFKLGEQTASEGKVVKQYLIVKTGGSQYTADSRFRNKHVDLYLLSNRKRITKEQNEQIKEYWREVEDYGYNELAFTVNWFYKLFGDKTKVYDNNCSTAARRSMAILGIRDNKFDDKVPNPTEFARFSYIKGITKISFKKKFNRTKKT